MKTKVLTLVTVLILIITSVNAQKVEKNLGEIEKLNLTGGLYILKQGQGKLIYEANADNNIAILYDSINKILDIETVNKMEIYLPNIKELNLTLASRLTCNDTFQTNYLKITANEASMCEINVLCDTLELVAEEASYINVKGECNYLNIKASEVSYINATDINAKTVYVEANEVSKVKVKATDTLEIISNNASFVTYYGTPKYVNIEDDSFIKNKYIKQYDTLDKFDKKISFEFPFSDFIFDDENNEEDSDTKNQIQDKSDKKTKQSNKKVEFSGHWASLDFLFTNYADPSLSYSLPPNYDFLDIYFPKSSGVQFNFFQQSIPFNKNGTLGMVTGLGIQWVNYRFGQKPIITDTKNGISFLIDTAKNVKKSKLTASYLQLPLLFEYQAKTKPYFHISVGAIGGVLIGSHTKIVYSSPDKVEKENGINSLYPFKYGVVCRFGIKHLSFTVQYNFSPLFKENKGPEVMPLEFGVTLISF
ncbi:MAG TPA: DUF2807 domain-containing protein [Bacteroidales bacterium]|jgi:hypothetical protein|nr:DUF2807 domain-containing protein [Bacteroidales bacterium]HOB77165.1 DUF2807 domain-containing protein [Bacteroidales bacterium]HQD58418.1 DUF2807 domain-containing protein [Bacteroidales bacterium]